MAVSFDHSERLTHGGLLTQHKPRHAHIGQTSPHCEANAKVGKAMALSDAVKQPGHAFGGNGKISTIEHGRVDLHRAHGAVGIYPSLQRNGWQIKKRGRAHL